MSKNKSNQTAKKNLAQATYAFFPFTNNRQPFFILALAGIIFYMNTIYNEFALDDGIIIHKNEFVMKGVAGIKDILSHDAYYSFYRQMNAKDQLAGGRYRPLSVVSFAIEQEIIGKHKTGIPGPRSWDTNRNGTDEPGEDINGDGMFNEYDTLVKGCSLRHFNNMLFYTLSVLLLFFLLKRYLFKNNQDLAFLAAFIFCIHPIHTEVVANMKSRDEIFSMLFIALTFIFSFKYAEEKKTKHAVLASSMFFLALLSKEYAATLAALVPLALYIFLPEPNWKKLSPLFAGMVLIFILYLKIRLSIVIGRPDVPDDEILNNPYLKASVDEKWATKIYVWLKYLRLLIWPHPLSSDYSYNTITYRNFSSWDTLLSILIHAGLVILTFVLFRRRHPLSFALLFYFANLAMVGNLFLDIGATMGERLIYHSSFGFAIIFAWVFLEAVKKLNDKTKLRQNVVLSSLTVMTLFCAFKTIQRNAEWKNDITLFTTDVKTVPNSVMCLGNAGARWLDLSDKPENKDSVLAFRNRAIGYLQHALELHPRYVNGYLNLGLAYYKLRLYKEAEETWGRAKTLYPSNPFLVTYYQILAQAYTNEAAEYGRAGKYKEAIEKLEKAASLNPNDAEIWYNLGGASYTVKDFARAKIFFENCLRLNPEHQLAKQGYASLPK